LLAQNPYKYGIETTKCAAELARGEAPAKPTEFTVLIGGKYIDAENVDSPEAQEFLYKESC
jgi:ABC-type sugar transport system substrate-binding protein